MCHVSSNCFWLAQMMRTSPILANVCVYLVSVNSGSDKQFEKFSWCVSSRISRAVGSSVVPSDV